MSIETRKDLPRTYRFDQTTVEILAQQSERYQCSQSEIIRRLVRASNDPIVAQVAGLETCSELTK